MKVDKHGLPSVCVGAPVSKQFRERARRARGDPTRAEAEAWELLRAKRTHGLRFRRQQPVLGYILDFYCPELRLGLELDGCVHDDPDQQIHDSIRDERLFIRGVFVLRIRNEEVRVETLQELLRPFLPRIKRDPAGSSSPLP